MSASPRTTVKWGPDDKTAAVSISLDNLGEAMDLSIGTWPDDKPVGSHYSVTEVLPRLLDVLAEEGVRCTYFIEGWSTGIYPDAVNHVRGAGHEIAYHGWRHEHWPDLDSREREAELLSRGVETFRRFGITLRGFRPPGGGLTPWTLQLLRDNGFAYCSPAARRAGLLDGIAALPFRWDAIDAYYFFDAFAPLRRQFGDSEEVLPPSRLEAGMAASIDDAVASAGYLSLLFHPFLENEPEHFEAMRNVIRMVARHDDIWCAPCSEHADWLLSNRELFAADPELDERSWQ
jgi:peptidoglycan/xylan/chitin deacetylase (PgdA/CDA1 family)